MRRYVKRRQTTAQGDGSEATSVCQQPVARKRRRSDAKQESESLKQLTQKAKQQKKSTTSSRSKKQSAISLIKLLRSENQVMYLVNNKRGISQYNESVGAFSDVMSLPKWTESLHCSWERWEWGMVAAEGMDDRNISLFDVRTKEACLLPKLDYERYAMGVAYHNKNKCVYLAGGRLCDRETNEYPVCAQFHIIATTDRSLVSGESDMPECVEYPIVVCGDDTVLVIGGKAHVAPNPSEKHQNKSGEFEGFTYKMVTKLQIYDISTREWRYGSDVPEPVSSREYGAVVRGGDEVVLFTNTACLIYHIPSNVWSHHQHNILGAHVTYIQPAMCGNELVVYVVKGNGDYMLCMYDTRDHTYVQVRAPQLRSLMVPKVVHLTGVYFMPKEAP